MEQPSLLLQLSSSTHQLNIDSTGGGGKGGRTQGEGLGKGGERWWEEGGEGGGF